MIAVDALAGTDPTLQAAAPRGLSLLAPELALVVGLAAILASDLVPALARRAVAHGLGIAACAVAFALALAAPRGDVAAMLAIDGLASAARLLLLPLAAAVLLGGIGERRAAVGRGGGDGGAWSASLLALALGAMVAAAASNFVGMWLGFELLALASYTLVAFRGGDARAAESGMKFVLFGGAASAAMLFGISHVYGLTGHLDFAGIGRVLAAGAPPGVGLALLLAALGCAYKLTLVPLHFYAPDVYQGAPPLAVAAVSTLPKVAAAAVLLRGLQAIAPEALAAPGTLAVGLAALAAGSALFAALLAVVQRDAKRILAFSGIGHGAAVALAAACAPGSDAAAAAGYYLLTYTVANLGAFVCLAVLERRIGSSDLGGLAGAWRAHPGVASVFTMFLVSLAGVPPLAGFLGKWGVLGLAFARGSGTAGQGALVAAVLVFLAATVVGAWSYLLVVRAVLFAEPAATNAANAASGATPARLGTATGVTLAVCGAATIWFGLWLDGFAVLRTFVGD